MHYKLGTVWPAEDGSHTSPTPHPHLTHIQLRAVPEYKYDPNAELIQFVNLSETFSAHLVIS